MQSNNQSIPKNRPSNNGRTPHKLIREIVARSDIKSFPRCCTEWGPGHRFRAKWPCWCDLCGQRIINVRVLVHDGDERTLYVGADCAKTVLYGRKGARNAHP